MKFISMIFASAWLLTKLKVHRSIKWLSEGSKFCECFKDYCGCDQITVGLSKGWSRSLKFRTKLSLPYKFDSGRRPLLYSISNSLVRRLSNLWSLLRCISGTFIYGLTHFSVCAAKGQFHAENRIKNWCKLRLIMSQGVLYHYWHLWQQRLFLY